MAHAVHQSQLVRGGSVVNFELLAFFFFVVRDDSMAQAEALNESPDVLVLWVRLVVKDLKNTLVLKVHICDTWCVLALCWL